MDEGIGLWALYNSASSDTPSGVECLGYITFQHPEKGWNLVHCLHCTSHGLELSETPC